MPWYLWIIAGVGFITSIITVFVRTDCDPKTDEELDHPWEFTEKEKQK